MLKDQEEDARKYQDSATVELSSELYDASKSTLEISFETKDKPSDKTWKPFYRSGMKEVNNSENSHILLCNLLLHVPFVHLARLRSDSLTFTRHDHLVRM